MHIHPQKGPDPFTGISWALTVARQSKGLVARVNRAIEMQNLAPVLSLAGNEEEVKVQMAAGAKVKFKFEDDPFDQVAAVCIALAEKGEIERTKRLLELIVASVDPNEDIVENKEHHNNGEYIIWRRQSTWIHYLILLDFRGVFLDPQMQMEPPVKNRYSKSLSDLIDEICSSYDGWISKAPKESFLRAAEALKIEHNFNKLWDLIFKNSVDRATHCNKLYELRVKARTLSEENQIKGVVDEFIASLPTGKLQTDFNTKYRDGICALLKDDVALDKKG